MNSSCSVINVASASVLQKLDQIEGGVWGIPCSVTLIDGACHDVCLASENRRYSDKGNWLNPNQVAEIRESKCRLPARFARIIKDAGESGMGYHVYVVELSDGTEFAHVAGNLTIDLLHYPVGYGPEDVANVRPHEGRDLPCREIKAFSSLEFARPS